MASPPPRPCAPRRRPCGASRDGRRRTTGPASSSRGTGEPAERAERQTDPRRRDLSILSPSHAAFQGGAHEIPDPVPRARPHRDRRSGRHQEPALERSAAAARVVTPYPCPTPPAGPSLPKRGRLFFDLTHPPAVRIYPCDPMKEDG